MRKWPLPVMLAMASCQCIAAPPEQRAMAAALPDIAFAACKGDRIEIYRYLRGDAFVAMYGPPPPGVAMPPVVEEVTSVAAATVRARRNNGPALSHEELLKALSRKTPVVLVLQNAGELDPNLTGLFRDDALILSITPAVGPPIAPPPAMPAPLAVPPALPVQQIPSR